MKVIMKHLGVYFKKHWVRYVIIVCSAILNSYLLVVPAKILGQIVNAIVDQSLTQSQLLGYIGFFFLIISRSLCIRFCINVLDLVCSFRLYYQFKIRNDEAIIMEKISILYEV